MRYCLLLLLVFAMSHRGNAQEIETIDKFTTGYINGTYMNKYKTIDGVLYAVGYEDIQQEAGIPSIMFTLIVVVLQKVHSRGRVIFRKSISLRQSVSLAKMLSLDASLSRVSTMRETMCQQLEVSLQMPKNIMVKLRKSLVTTSQVTHVSHTIRECR